MPARRAAAASLLAALLSTGAPRAHLRFPTVKAERWIELRLGEEPIRVGYRLGFGATLATELRKAADRDGDFQVSAAECNAALDARTAALLAALSVCTGRTLDDLRCRRLTTRDIERVESEGWAPGQSGHLHFIWTFRLAERANEIGAFRLEDAYDVPGIEISDVQIDRPLHTPLARAGDGALSAGVTERFNWIERQREPGPRVVVAAWAPPLRRFSSGLMAAAALVLAAAAAWLLSRRSRPKMR